MYNRELARLVDDAIAWLLRERVPAEDRSVEVALDLRYSGQAYELPIPVSAPLDDAAWRQAQERFHAEHKRRYGYDQPFANVEVVTLRVTAVGALPKPQFQSFPDEGPDAGDALVDCRPVYFDDRWVESPFYDRTQLRTGNEIAGPAIVLQPDCTTVLHPGQSLRVDSLGNLLVSTGA
jgi:N-methylhydantoinase A